MPFAYIFIRLFSTHKEYRKDDNLLGEIYRLGFGAKYSKMECLIFLYLISYLRMSFISKSASYEGGTFADGLAILFGSCSTSIRMVNEAFNHALVGQDELTVYSRLGPPTRTIPTSDGGKILVYEFYSKGMFETPYISKITYNPKENAVGERQGFTFNSGVNTATNDPKYTLYQNDVSYLKILLNNKGTCVNFEQNLDRDQLERYYQYFKSYNPSDK